MMPSHNTCKMLWKINENFIDLFLLLKKWHTCEEGGAHHRISFWHLLTNFEKPEKSEFWKNEKKNAWDIIVLRMCIKSYNHMKYSSWDTELDIIFFSFWAIFCPFTPTPLTTQKTKILKKWICHVDMSLF